MVRDAYEVLTPRDSWTKVFFLFSILTFQFNISPFCFSSYNYTFCLLIIYSGPILSQTMLSCCNTFTSSLFSPTTTMSTANLIPSIVLPHKHTSLSIAIKTFSSCSFSSPHSYNSDRAQIFSKLSLVPVNSQLLNYQH